MSHLQDESCIATLRGLECTTWQAIMTEVFKIGQIRLNNILRVVKYSYYSRDPLPVKQPVSRGLLHQS